MKDGRVTVCAAGYSRTLGFVRVYPTTLFSPLKNWNIVSVPVERNPQDSRPESWKIEGSKGEWSQLHKKIEVVGTLSREERIKLIPTLATGCVNDLNDKHVSLGVVKPVELSPILGERPDVDHSVQKTLWGGELPKAKTNYDTQPRLQYRCSACRTAKSHDQQIIELGCYEWFRKNPGKEAQVFENLHVEDDEYEKYLLVGNQNNHRTSYLIITVLRWKK